MSDTKSMLPTGSGMPYVIVSDSNNKPIIDPNTKLPVSMNITSFEYEYNEEKDDKCEITFTCKKPEFADLPQFQVQQYLLVQWGFTYSNGESAPSPVRKVMVRDIKLRLSAASVLVIIQCTDGLSILKTKNLTKNKEDNFLSWIQQSFSNNYKFRCFFPESKEIKAKKPLPKWTILTTPKQGIGGWTCNYDYPKPEEEGLKEVEPDKLVKRRTFMQIGKTPYTALKDATKTIPNGPYHLDGRDDTISIHPTNFNQAPIAQFTWAGGSGELLSLTIETKKKQKAIDTVQKTKIDGKTKSLNSQMVQTDGHTPNLSYDAVTQESIPITQYSNTETTKKSLEKNENILKKNAAKYLNDVVQQYEQSNGDPKKIAEISLETYKVPIKVKVRETVDPRNYGTPGSDVMGEKTGSRAVGWDKLKRDKSVIIANKPDGSRYQYWDNPEVIMDKEIELELSGLDLLGYAGDVDTSSIMGFNKVADALQKSVQSNITVVGQPYLVSSKIITLQNISKVYSGDWYIKTISHKVDMNSGYLCTLDLIKKTSANGTLVKSNTTVNMPSLAKKIQNIAKAQSDPVAIAKAKEVKSAQEEILNDYKNMGDVYVFTDESGMPVAVKANEDWVSVNKATKTEQINQRDAELKKQTKKK